MSPTPKDDPDLYWIWKFEYADLLKTLSGPPRAASVKAKEIMAKKYHVSYRTIHHYVKAGSEFREQRIQKTSRDFYQRHRQRLLPKNRKRSNDYYQFLKHLPTYIADILEEHESLSAGQISTQISLNYRHAPKSRTIKKYIQKYQESGRSPPIEEIESGIYLLKRE